MNSQTAKRLYQKAKYGPAANKNIRAILRKELLTNFGFEHMFLMADILIDRCLVKGDSHYSALFPGADNLQHS